jgi:hypothetical protein
MPDLSPIDGNTLEGVSATTLCPHNRGSEANRANGVIRAPGAVTLFDG